MPQRGFLLGIPLAVIVFTQWWAAMNSANSKEQSAKGKETRSAEKLQARLTDTSPFAPGSLLSRRMLAAGVVAGLLPLIHAHSFITVMGVGACLALINWRQWRAWLTFLLVASMIAGPQLLWSTHGSAVSTRAFIGWEFGWGHGNENFFWFWLKNTGLFIPLLLIALLWKREDYLVSRKLLLFYLPFTLCFIIPNVLKLAPWI